MFYHRKTNQRDFEYTSIKVSVKDTDADDLYVECIIKSLLSNHLVYLIHIRLT
ncbi:hypothetical protein BW1_087_00080 [Bacillus mycoides NBRC 101238 = DSM 11821]|nr:hypothetical protein BW1_087_00080 [Bacillus mycoides NBRC 101238 = DSM 11821]